MNIGVLVAEAIDHLEKKEFPQALADLSIAIDATAQREFKTKGRKTYKDFIGQNMYLITKAATGLLATGDIRFPLQHPDLKAGPDGNVSLRDVLYHLVRCGLLHEWSLPSCICFSPESKISHDGRTITLPTSLIHGLALAVVASPVNKDQTIAPRYIYFARGTTLNIRLRLNDYWGKRDEVRKLLGIT